MTVSRTGDSRLVATISFVSISNHSNNRLSVFWTSLGYCNTLAKRTYNEVEKQQDIQSDVALHGEKKRIKEVEHKPSLFRSKKPGILLTLLFMAFCLLIVSACRG